MKGFNIPEGAHVINALPPISLAASPKSDTWSMKGYAHADIIIQLGAAVQVEQITLLECIDTAATDDNALPFKYYSEVTANGDVLERQTDALAAGFATASAGTANTMHIISVDASEMTEGYDYLAVQITGAGGAQLGSVVAILTGSRYGEEASPTALV